MYARTNMRIKGRWICNLYNKFIIKHFYRMKRFTVLLIWNKKKINGPEKLILKILR